MRSIDDPTFDAKALVARGYDRCAGAYAAARGTAVPPWLAVLTGRLPAGAAVLDIGCGCGVPVARALAERFVVTGVDISARQIELARRNVPAAAAFIHGDIMARAFAPKSFDAAVMLYTLLHLPRHEHAEILRRIRTWLRPNGLLLVTLARTSHAGYTEDGFFSATMYWSHFAERDYRSLLEQAGFALLHARKIGHGYRKSLGAKAEAHPLVLARGMQPQPLEGARAAPS